MEWDTIIQAIGTVGFPIIACIALFYLLYRTMEQHKKECEAWTEALGNNTTAIVQLTEALKK